MHNSGNALAVQWLGLQASTAGGRGLIPGRGTKIPQVAWCGKKEKKYDRMDMCGPEYLRKF